MTKNALVCGGGGFIGGHLAADLLSKGFKVRCVDIKPIQDWQQVHPQAENVVADLSLRETAFSAIKRSDIIYNLASDMGGIGFLETHKAKCMLNVLINTQLLLAAQEYGVERFFFASSACVYGDNPKQKCAEEDAYPALPQDGYGWEKLFSERMCRHFREDFDISTRVARFHNVYGPFGIWEGGREKAPEAICRKVIEAKLSGKHEIEIWGDGEQTRSFMYINDCIQGINLVTDSQTWHDPINVGSPESVTINELVDVVEEFAGIKLTRRHNPTAPKGPAGRSSDNTLLKKIFHWQPSIPLREGMEQTYKLIYRQYTKKSRGLAGTSH